MNCRSPVRGRQSGLAIVEFALVGLLSFIILYGAIEFGRLMYTWNTMTEGTRRGARVAAVCPMNDPAIANATIFRTPSGSDALLEFPDLTTSNVRVEYLTATGTPAATLAAVDFVRVSVVNFELTLFIPLLMPTISMPTFSTTLPAESLGIVPGSAPACTFP